MSKTVELKAQIQWRAGQGQTGRWIGVCDAMNLAVEAESLDEMCSLINETLHLTLVDLLEDNELEAFLRARGWEARGIPTRISQKVLSDINFSVPWELIAEGALDKERCAH